MPIEIERKFLVAEDGWKSEVVKEVPMVQGCLVAEPERAVRVRIPDAGPATLTIKGATRGATRVECEYEIPRDEDHRILDLCRQPIIEKTRHLVECNGDLCEIDIFEGANQGLRIVETELSSESQEFEQPEWLGREVTDDLRFFNAPLVDRPYADWTRQDQ